MLYVFIMYVELFDLFVGFIIYYGTMYVLCCVVIVVVAFVYDDMW
jgi:hypothetical protein